MIKWLWLIILTVCIIIIFIMLNGHVKYMDVIVNNIDRLDDELRRCIIESKSLTNNYDKIKEIIVYENDALRNDIDKIRVKCDDNNVKRIEGKLVIIENRLNDVDDKIIDIDKRIDEIKVKPKRQHYNNCYIRWVWE